MTRDIREPQPADPLRHHGDVDAEPGLLDFAVNVRATEPPRWLLDRLAAELPGLARYPSARYEEAARAAVAARHGREPDEVLPLSGAAEAFALLPRLRPRHAVVVHPSFTEPEAALRAADIPVHRVLLEESEGFALRPELIPDEADLVILGNPTNPTGRLHHEVAELARPGRLLVVDEAFADAVEGEPGSLAAQGIPGVLVVRSLTKTFAIAGLRAGYLLGEPELLARLHAHRPQWPVGTLGLAAIAECASERAVRAAALEAREIAAEREWLTARLTELGVHVCGPGVAPFLLLRVPDGERMRLFLRDKGIAVRRCDTFPGLGPDHLRIAVRERALASRLLEAMEEELCRYSPR
ncbi:Rv2231c family pyridoxal phosphate-dependent protein CobC [Sciscionella sediminilitoris]|uniref:Rv2231c family pyridoxal phosphate-dependent protein CobC n=1 Tax=Sciscionella sediminilitoris TaxID=1445613 RepID=UPI0004DEF007|nr:Rv2231c family pyridoxal phosphate-dependent protein CobC [Sciscionella sp. SE31]